MRSTSLLLGLVLAFSCVPPTTRAAECEPGLQTVRDLRSVRNVPGFSGGELRKRQLAEVDELLARRPDDVFLHLNYLQVSWPRNAEEKNAQIERYKLLGEQHPGNPEYEFLYAVALVDANTPDAISRLKQLLTGGQSYPLAHLELARIYEWGKFADRAEMRTELNSYYGACPGSLYGAPHRLLEEAATPEMAAKYAAQFRKRLESETQPEFDVSWAVVWNLEFQASPPAQHAEVRKQIQADLQNLNKNPQPHDVLWLSTMAIGYHLADDEQAQRRVENQIVANYPANSEAKRILRERWKKEHPYPKNDDSEASKQAYQRAYLAMNEDGLKKDPNDFEYLLGRFETLSQIKDTTDDQIVAAGEALRTALRQDPGWRSMPPFEFQIAREYLKRKIRADEVPVLVEEFWRSNWEYPPSDRDSKDFADSRVFEAMFLKINAALVLVDAATQLKKPEIAQSVVMALADVKPDKRFLEEQLWEVKAKWAALNGRKLDALLMYRTVIEMRAMDGSAKHQDKNEAQESYEQLWKELGGTEEGKAALAKENKVREVASEGGWEKPDKELPVWELLDLEGKTWKLVSLKGKTLLINVWATWCGACTEELPYLQKLYERTKDRTDIQILTFDIDDEIGDVSPFIKQNKYTFPVLLAKDYAFEFVTTMGIPQNWIIDTTGHWRWKSIGFGGDEEWEKHALEKLGAAKPQ